MTLAPSRLAHAAVISEVLFSSTFLQPPGSPGGVAPPYVELNNLPAGRAIDLVVVRADASPVRHGLVLQVFTLPAGTATRLLAQGEVPAAVLRGADPAVVQPLPAGVTFNFSPTLPRSLLLFDGVTGLSVDQLISNQPEKLVGKPLLDALTFGTGATPHAGEPVWGSVGATAAFRPRVGLNDPGHTWIWGVPSTLGLVGETPYRLTPGHENFVEQVPEPASAAIWAAAAGLLGLRRRQR